MVADDGAAGSVELGVNVDVIYNNSRDNSRAAAPEEA